MSKIIAEDRREEYRESVSKYIKIIDGVDYIPADLLYIVYDDIGAFLEETRVQIEETNQELAGLKSDLSKIIK